MQSNGENLNARFENRGVKITASEELIHSGNPEPFTHRRVRHPREFQLWLSEFRCRAEGLTTRHPREFQIRLRELRCRAEGLTTRPPANNIFE